MLASAAGRAKAHFIDQQKFERILSPIWWRGDKQRLGKSVLIFISSLQFMIEFQDTSLQKERVVFHFVEQTQDCVQLAPPNIHSHAHTPLQASPSVEASTPWPWLLYVVELPCKAETDRHSLLS